MGPGIQGSGEIEKNQLRPEGDSFEMESAAEKITLCPVRGAGSMTKEHGVRVFHFGQTLSASATDEMVREIREERDVSNLEAE